MRREERDTEGRGHVRRRQRPEARVHTPRKAKGTSRCWKREGRDPPSQGPSRRPDLDFRPLLCERTNVCFFQPLLGGILFQQPQDTSMVCDTPVLEPGRCREATMVVEGEPVRPLLRGELRSLTQPHCELLLEPLRGQGARFLLDTSRDPSSTGFPELGLQETLTTGSSERGVTSIGQLSAFPRLHPG